MVLPLKNNFGSLPPDIGSNPTQNNTQSSTDYSTQPSQNVSGLSIQPVTTSYVHVASTAPVKKFSPRNSANLRTEVSLYRSLDSDNKTSSSSGVIHRTGTTDNSVFYHIPHHLKHMRVAFSIALSDKFPFGIGLGLTTQESSKGTIVEVTLASKEACEEAITTPLSVEDQIFSAVPAVHPDRALMKVNLSKIPIMPIDKLKTKLLNNFARYGIVRELVIFFDNWGQRWFAGNGCVYLERPANSEIQFEKLTYKIPLDDDHSCLGTWSRMERHCVYCKSMGHLRKDCPSLPTETRNCYVCHSRGHIARNCPKVTNPNQSSSKRRRAMHHDNFTETPKTILTKPREITSPSDTDIRRLDDAPITLANSSPFESPQSTVENSYPQTQILTPKDPVKEPELLTIELRESETVVHDEEYDQTMTDIVDVDRHSSNEASDDEIMEEGAENNHADLPSSSLKTKSKSKFTTFSSRSSKRVAKGRSSDKVADVNHSSLSSQLFKHAISLVPEVEKGAGSASPPPSQ